MGLPARTVNPLRPHDWGPEPDHEKALLEACTDPASVDWILETFRTSDFAPRHALIFNVVRQLREAGAVPDLLTMREKLRDVVLGDSSITDEYLSDIAGKTPRTCNLRYHGGQVLKARAQKAFAAGNYDEGKRHDARMEAVQRGRSEEIHVYDDVEISELPPPLWAVDNVLPQSGLGILFGPPGSGKGFAAIDVAFCIATDTPWAGRAVLPGTVAYIAAEGAPGLTLRVPAWKVQNEIAPTARVGAYFIPGPRSLLLPAEVDRLIAALEALPGPLRLIWIDTLARTIAPGNESATEDMSNYVAACDKIREATGAFLGVIHHSGWNNDRERGSSALYGAADVKIKIQKAGKLLTLSCEKQRDAEEFEPIYLEMVQSLQSCALITPGAGSELAAANLPTNQRTALLTLVEKFFDDGASTTQWITASGLADSSFYDARKPLVERGYVEKVGKGKGARYVPTQAGQDAVTPKVRGYSE